jgi:FkbM family methyltransferase
VHGGLDSPMLRSLRHAVGSAKLRFHQWCEAMRYDALLTNGDHVLEQKRNDDAGKRASLIRTLDFKNGPSFAVRDGASAAHTFAEIFLEDCYPRELLVGAETIIDVGANIGLFSYYARRQAPAARIFAFEADPATFKLLVENTRHLSVDCSHRAVASCDDEIEFFSAPISAWSSMYAVLGAAGGERVKVRATRLSEFVRQREIRQIDVLKIDVEGAEYDILLGDTKLWKTSIKALLVEVDRQPRDTRYAYESLRRHLADRFARIESPNWRSDYPLLICSN